jgi:transitional endoplasmic reticulum ATPase
VKGPELISKWVGESEKHVREIFKKARQVSPCIIFFDEFDSISKQRGSSLSDSTERVVNQLLTELDGIEELERVMVIAATNRKDLIDSSLLRSGRIDSHIELKIPDEKTREKIIEVHTKRMPLENNFEVKDYVSKTNDWTGADLESLAKNAGINAIKRFYKVTKDSDKLKITKEDFERSYQEVKKNVDSRKMNEIPNFEDMKLPEIPVNEKKNKSKA